MNAFDLNRKEYIRVNNNNSGKLTNFKKVTFLTSFVITADSDKYLPISYDGSQILSSNDNLFTNVAQYCTDTYADGNGYACYISEISVLHNDVDVNIPYAKVNVYLMDGREVVV